MKQQPETILACDVGRISIALRKFTTINGGQFNPSPYTLQILSGDWRTKAKYADLELAVRDYEGLVKDYEETVGERSDFTPRKWTVSDIPPALSTTASDLREALYRLTRTGN